ncbi:hypothetical protein RHGRI_026540 [Rhododendron griersonianum]|uniref:Uncharacterized protein n=1 Tax=Rhododendron griersonianum TaxID=479676 RepID=A0AAV6IWT9_9ERIC|nr:hypothetical protein RHGRI_026540 [Rhododendron griersonianum]
MRSAGSRNNTHRDSTPDEIQNTVRPGIGDAQQRNQQDNAEKEAEGEKGNRTVGLSNFKHLNEPREILIH